LWGGQRLSNLGVGLSDRVKAKSKGLGFEGLFGLGVQRAGRVGKKAVKRVLSTGREQSIDQWGSGKKPVEKGAQGGRNIIKQAPQNPAAEEKRERSR